MERAFRTKTGFCHITDDEIILSRDGIRGNVAKVTVGNSISRILVIYGIASMLLLLYAFSQYQHDHVIEAALFGALGAYLVSGIMRSLNNSAAPVIDRKAIRQVKFVRGVRGLTRSRFEVLFDERGRIKKRLILLPGSMSDGERENEKAVALKRSERLID
jgi:hypothetical protein